MRDHLSQGGKNRFSLMAPVGQPCFHMYSYAIANVSFYFAALFSWQICNYLLLNRNKRAEFMLLFHKYDKSYHFVGKTFTSMNTTISSLLIFLKIHFLFYLELVPPFHSTFTTVKWAHSDQSMINQCCAWFTVAILVNKMLILLIDFSDWQLHIWRLTEKFFLQNSSKAFSPN